MLKTRLFALLVLVIAGASLIPLAGVGAAPDGPPDFSKFPDVSGLRLGMSVADAMAVMKKLYPRGVGQMNVGPFGHQVNSSVLGVLRAKGDANDEAAVDFTAPPNAQVVWHISRNVPQPKVAHNVIVNGLRQKFGKETWAVGLVGRKLTDDSQIQQMWWVFDEQGHLMPPSPQATTNYNTPYGCNAYYNADGSPHIYMDAALGKDLGLPTFCTSSYVGVEVSMSPDPILTSLLMDMVDLPLMVRSAKATGAWANGLDQKDRQQELQRENTAKPTL